ncbi:glycerophosphodiester phosphodiesterase family protein [Hymenobacter coalescens]
MSASTLLPARPLVYGHRGCRGLRPENTIPAFLHALEWGVDGLELDVVVSADGQVVVSHEPWLNSAICTAPDGAGLSVEEGRAFNFYEQPYAAILRYDCGQRGHPLFPEQRPEPAYKPLLTEVFAAVAHACSVSGRALPAFSIELKSTPDEDHITQPAPAEFVTRVQQVIEAFWLAADASARPTILLMSFDHRVVRCARQLTSYHVCLLIEDHISLTGHLQRLGFVPDALGPDYVLLTEELLRFCAAAQLPIITWTVNEVDALRAVAGWGVHGITTDYPNRAAEVFRC